MKRILSIIVALVLSLTIFAQAPQKMSYQAVIRDANNNLVVNKSVGMRISILQGSATGTAVYTETQTPTTNANGLVSIEFGGGTGFSSIDWSTSSYFIKTETDLTGGTNYTITGTSQMLSVPYALYAGKATNGFSGNYNDLTNKPNLHVSKTGDTLFLGNNQYVLIAGISYTNYYSKMIIDGDGNIYDTVLIGSQTWIKTNLKTTKYNDGKSITNVTDNTTWSNLTSGAYCSYNNTINADTINNFGRLYNWYAVNTGKLCPKGWHVPSIDEWSTLLSHLEFNGFNYDGSIGNANNYVAKSLASNMFWNNSINSGSIGNNLSNNNQTGFSARPGGYRNSYGIFGDFGNFGYWFSSTEVNLSQAYSKFLKYDNPSLINDNGGKSLGYSIRCIKD